MYHTQLAKMGFDKIIDLTAAVYFYFSEREKRTTTILERWRKQNKKTGYCDVITCNILNEDTQLVIRAIGVSHTACKMTIDKIFDLTAGVYFHFL